MSQLLVRKIDRGIVRRLKERAQAHGVSAEEEHRRILREALEREEPLKPTLMEFLLSPAGQVLPDVELDLSRSKVIEERELGF
ncbi:MAG: FitA-like ribbon-helix-helix domain-containing protein [Opitutales bacterium]